MTPATLLGPTTTPNERALPGVAGTGSYVRESTEYDEAPSADPSGMLARWLSGRGTAAPLRPRRSHATAPPRQPDLVLERDGQQVIFEFKMATGAKPGGSDFGTLLLRLRRLGRRDQLDEREALETAAALKRAALQFRNSSRQRHAAVLLSLADALTFTEAEELGPDGPTALLNGVALLTEPFVSESAEEELLVDLLTHGWNLAPAADGNPLDA